MRTLQTILVATCVGVTALCSLGACSVPEKEVYMFTSHREPALDGLHFLYSYDGLHWDSLAGSWLKPEIGNKTKYVNSFTGEEVEPKYCPNSMMRDPSLLQGPDGTFHLVWTLGWSGEKSFGYASSKDLIHWSEQRKIPVMADSLTNNVWAPELFYDDEKGEYMIIWSSAIRPECYTAADSLGTNGSHRTYYTTTKDFQTFAPTQPYYDPGFNSIDGFLVKRGPKDYVYILKDNRKLGFSDLFCVFGESPEGPFVHPTEKFGAVSTKDFQTFTPADDRISIPKGHKHGTIFKVKESVLKKMKEAEAERLNANPV